MIIAFTGHRDKLVDPRKFDALPRDALWVHGGAIGFDSQVEAYAKAHGIPTMVILPDYDRYGRTAPLERNKLSIKQAHKLIALYDGRKYGGTFYTINLAKKKGIEIEYW